MTEKDRFDNFTIVINGVEIHIEPEWPEKDEVYFRYSETSCGCTDEYDTEHVSLQQLYRWLKPGNSDSKDPALVKTIDELQRQLTAKCQSNDQLTRVNQKLLVDNQTLRKTLQILKES